MPGRVGWYTVVVLLVLATVITVGSGVNGDIKYELGAQLTSPAGPAETFTHRPLPYRLGMAGLGSVASALTEGYPAFEAVLRAETALLVVLSGVVLALGLRRYRPDGVVLAVVATAGVLLLGANPALEPDWVAIVVTLAGVGAGLVFRSALPSVVLAGLLLAAAATIKLVTLPVAVLGLLAMLVLDRRRALLTAAAATAFGLGYVALLAAFFPLEIRWTLDGAAIQADRPVAEQVLRGLQGTGDAAILWPAILVLPATLVGATAREVALTLAAVGLAVVPVLVQGQFYAYHYTPLAAVAALAAYAAVRRARSRLVLPFAALGAGAGVLLSLPAGARVDALPLWFGLAATAALAVAAAQGWLLRRGEPAGAGQRAGAVPVLAVLALTLPAVLPTTAWSFSLHPARVTTAFTNAVSADWRARAGQQVRDRIGADTPVTYLTFGDGNYYVRNPTTCRYPTNIFLQRSQYGDRHHGTASFRENLDCLSDPRPAWLVWDQSWFRVDRMPPDIERAVESTFDCDLGFTAARWTVCPRRAVPPPG